MRTALLFLFVFASAWATAQKTTLVVPIGHTGPVNSVAYSPNGQLLASGSDDNTIKLWSVKTGQLLYTFQIYGDEMPFFMRFSPDGQQLVYISGTKTIKLWSVKTGQLLHNSRGYSALITSLCFSPDGQQLASGSEDGTINLWSVKTGQLSHTLQGHGKWVSSVCFSPDSQQLVSGSDDNTTKIWNSTTGQEIATLIAVDSTDWVVTTPSGLFDASPGAMKLMRYVVNDSTDRDEPWKVVE